MYGTMCEEVCNIANSKSVCYSRSRLTALRVAAATACGGGDTSMLPTRSLTAFGASSVTQESCRGHQQGGRAHGG